MVDEHEILAGVQKIKRRRLRLILSLPFAFGIFILSGLITEYLQLQTDVLVGFAAVGGFAAWGINGIVYVYSHCPNCSKLFFNRGWYGNAFARRCLNCKLPLSFKVGHCMECGYNLHGLEDPRCPECGTSFENKDD